MDDVPEGVVPEGCLNILTLAVYDDVGIGPQIEMHTLQEPACASLCIPHV